jgi:PAS domain S-box-containing protein
MRDQKHFEQREPDEKTLKKLLRFEQMVSEFSARLMATPLDQVDSMIENALRQVMKFFQIDRCGMLKVMEDDRFVRITHAVYDEGVEHVTGDLNLAKMFPWSYGKLLQGKHITISRVEDYPEDALMDRQSHEALGIRSTLTIPLAVDGRISRMMVIQHTRRNQVWPEEYVPRIRLLGEILVNALERRMDRLQVEEQLAFEVLLAEISGHFVNLPADQVDSEIEDAQRRLCEFLGLDLSTLWQWSMETPRILTMTHFYRPLGGPPVPEPMYAHEYFPWSQQQVEAGRIIVISSLEDYPAEAARDKETRVHFGIKSTLTFPLSTGGGLPVGALSFDTMQHERIWPDKLIQRLQLVAQVFINALVRKKTETALRESEARLSITTEAVGGRLWVMDIGTKNVWVSPKSRELFHLAPDEEITYDSYFEVIHPEDRGHVHQAVQHTLQSGENLLCDYRIVLPDGSIRWVVARGQRFVNSSGEPDHLMGLSLDITERKNLEIKLKDNFREIEQLKAKLERENIYLRDEVRHIYAYDEIVGDSDALRQVKAQAEQVAPTNSTVLISGETGTGKELLARAIHYMSTRKDRTLVTVNCASLPPTLIDSELFGREKGAYTGALTRMTGRFELADGSTLFLDEIGDLPLEVQSKLLRVLEYGQFERLGSTRTVKVNIRLIAATNRDLTRDISEGRFRKDLFFRLNVFPITVPPLRERKDDIPPLVWSFVKQLGKTLGKRVESIPKRNMDALMGYSWPGNIRELRNVVEHALIMSRGRALDIELPVSPHLEPVNSHTLEDIERRHIFEVLERTGWRISGKNSASEILGMKRTTLQSRMKVLGIKRSSPS